MARPRKSCRFATLTQFGIMFVMFTMTSICFFVNYFGITPTENQDQHRLQKVILAKSDNNKVEHGNLQIDPACSYQPDELKNYPECNNKSVWMRQRWGSDPCYKTYGVNGTECSIIIYLSEVETWCPILKWRQHFKPKQATWRKNIVGLVEILDNAEKKQLEWLKTRIQRMWNTKWMPAVDNIIKKNELTNREQKEVFIHMGFLTGDFARNAKTGGPLGEMVQWSDIITSLYILGHNIVISVDQKLNGVRVSKSSEVYSCPEHLPPIIRPYDLVYTDIDGLANMKKYFSDNWSQSRCKFRVIDSFGTEPSFNIHSYMKKTNRKSLFGGWELNPQQFFTLFPHSPDNSFMGFIVDHDNSIELMEPANKKNKALVYAKRSYMWKDYNAQQILDVVNKTFEIHATVHINRKKVDEVKSVPSYVNNHGVLSGGEIQKLLRQTKLFIGIGFPYEGPAPLEAIANGCFYLNPSFSPAKNKLNTKFFIQKPTERELTSQNPYAEVYIGKPHVWTVDVLNSTALREAVEEIGKADAPKPYLPFEFQCEGMLQRLSTYISHQDFCTSSSSWPPKSSMHVRLAKPNQSCKARCVEDGLICEPSWFPLINFKEVIEKQFGTTCSETEELQDVCVPSINPMLKSCQIQKQNLLFSCVGQREDLQRICPCRTYIKGQVALCKECL